MANTPPDKIDTDKIAKLIVENAVLHVQYLDSQASGLTELDAFLLGLRRDDVWPKVHRHKKFIEDLEAGRKKWKTEDVEDLGKRIEEAVEEAVEKRAAKHPGLADFVKAYGTSLDEPNRTARQIFLHPKLRMAYYANPRLAMAHHVPAGDGLEGWVRERLRYFRPETRMEREKLAIAVESLLSADTRMVSARETFYEREAFLKSGIQNPERTFGTVYWMSIITFFVGIALVAVGIYLAIDAASQDDGSEAAAVELMATPSSGEEASGTPTSGDASETSAVTQTTPTGGGAAAGNGDSGTPTVSETSNETMQDGDDTLTIAILSGIFGTAGVMTALVTVFRASSGEIRSITADIARVHIALTSFAAGTTRLRALPTKTADEAKQTNEQMSALAKSAVELLPREREQKDDTKEDKDTDKKDKDKEVKPK